jgi:thioredoxin reductase (NADPH)
VSAPVILAVDDDRTVREAVARDLRARYGADYRVVVAGSGAEGVDVLERLRLRNEAAALVVADQRMPGMTGVELLERSVELAPAARRVLLTAYADTEAAIRAINRAQVDHYLLKPWDPPEDRLYPVLDDLLGTWEPPPVGADLRVVGHRWSRASHELRTFLGRNLVPYRWLDVESSPEAEELLRLTGQDGTRLPVVVHGDGSVQVVPAAQEVADRIGLRVRAERPAYDLVVVGAGPAGLAAGVYGASEGYATLVVDRLAPGGQAGMSARIENYLGFPVGLSGAELTSRARQQAVRLGAELLNPQDVVALRCEDPHRVVCFDDGTEVSCRALVIATGVSYRTLDVPGVEALTGAGVYYGAGRAEAAAHEGQDVFIVGGGNSAGQAAVFLAQFAKRVTILVRGGGLAETMSAYLIGQIVETDNIDVRARTGIGGARGDGHLQRLLLDDLAAGTTSEVAADALFVFIGMAPRTEWVAGELERDRQGFLYTGTDLGPHPRGWRLARVPLPLETNVPGVFAAGDVRFGSIKRVASAVGEGAMAVRFIYEHLESS